MDKEKAKINGRIRYDNPFKQSAIQMITEQHIPIKEVSKELGVSIVRFDYTISHR